MNEEKFDYPRAIRTPDNAAYLDSWKEGKMMLQHCPVCDRSIFYPRAMCPYCWNPDLKWIQSNGAGIVLSYSLIHRPNHPSFNHEVPIALAEIELSEGVTLLARILDGTPQTGMQVILANEPECTVRYPLPVFRLVG